MAMNDWQALTATGAQDWVRIERGAVGIAFHAGAAGVVTIENSKDEVPGTNEVVKLGTYGADIIPPVIYDATENSEWIRFNVTTADPNAKGRFSQKGRST